LNTAGNATTFCNTEPDMKPSPLPRKDITAVILAGGRARRMHGADKGLVELRGRPLVDYSIAGLRPQVDRILVNANRNLARYREFGYLLIADSMEDYCGPLAGIASAMQAAGTPLLLTVPCDSPFLPARLLETLYRAMTEADADISVAHDGKRLQQMYALLHCTLLPDLLDYLDNGGRKVDSWYAHHHMAVADFSSVADSFLNLNTPADMQALETRLAATQAAR
jgi:molybdopterin-guanine dinucleotide biosynthesis protein A